MPSSIHIMRETQHSAASSCEYKKVILLWPNNIAYSRRQGPNLASDYLIRELKPLMTNTILSSPAWQVTASRRSCQYCTYSA